MTECDYRYFIARGRSLEIAEAVMAERRAAFEQAKAIMAEVGASNIYGQPRLVGFSFPGGLPDGWRYTSRRGSPKYAMPEKRDKRWKSLRERIEAIRLVGAHELHDRLGFDLCITKERAPGLAFCIASTAAEQIGDLVILKVPIDHAGRLDNPADAEPLKRSEYWRLKEDREQLATEAA